MMQTGIGSRGRLRIEFFDAATGLGFQKELLYTGMGPALGEELFLCTTAFAERPQDPEYCLLHSAAA